MADNVMNSKERSTYDGLGAKKLRFGDIMNKCETGYNNVLTWGKSK